MIVRIRTVNALYETEYGEHPGLDAVQNAIERGVALHCRLTGAWGYGITHPTTQLVLFRPDHVVAIESDA